MYPSISSTDIYFGDSSCRGSLSRNVLQYTFGFQDCLTNEKISNDTIIYENKLVYATLDTLNPHIIRNHVWTYTIECDVIRREATSYHIHHDVNTHHSSVVVHNNINLGFYSDPSFTREIPGNPLHASVGGTIYVKVYTTVNDWSIKMRLHSCYTKPWQNSNSTSDYMLINDGCEVDGNTHIMSQSTHETTFMFQDFEYTGNPEGLDVYCNATFCQASDFTPTCLQACNLQH
ncbi:hypothetical protein DPMN_110574 [Dreissena polymorpha]|uniref:ZP domain-containing protein n=1 Tax=Dreissena polymorpha TaxID=45954 RepID=A0A9D4QN81_DREPO|nr:hypothetical protein DPMN_110574 [Dreissena polymorpha]